MQPSIVHIDYRFFILILTKIVRSTQLPYKLCEHTMSSVSHYINFNTIVQTKQSIFYIKKYIFITEQSQCMIHNHYSARCFQYENPSS